jgi:hypothetical protein
MRFSELPPGLWFLYSQVPEKKLTTAIAIATAGMPKPQPPLVCIQTSTEAAITAAPILIAKTELIEERTLPHQSHQIDPHRRKIRHKA